MKRLEEILSVAFPAQIVYIFLTDYTLNVCPRVNK